MSATVGKLRRAPTPALFLSYLPDGAPELGMVALVLMIDPAMVAAHHVLRVGQPSKLRDSELRYRVYDCD
ncbi:hypothetical protein [Pacificibacter marinus]|uniref:hypothetical protein n=1 Tax=Pacificibacter marinus TaxID=658057 RepID=UPI000A26E65E|nr:hypothetical protein [Pacificibacter marinus]